MLACYDAPGCPWSTLPEVIALIGVLACANISAGGMKGATTALFIKTLCRLSGPNMLAEEFNQIFWAASGERLLVGLNSKPSTIKR
jgi:hypothetical protein